MVGNVGMVQGEEGRSADEYAAIFYVFGGEPEQTRPISNNFY